MRGSDEEWAWWGKLGCSQRLGPKEWVGINQTELVGKIIADRDPKTLGFPGGTVVKNPPANAGDTSSSPGPGRSHMPQSN